MKESGGSLLQQPGQWDTGLLGFHCQGVDKGAVFLQENCLSPLASFDGVLKELSAFRRKPS
jgi:hypothetical protein